MLTRLALAACSLLLELAAQTTLAGPPPAAGPRVGDPAPSLQGTQWLKGEAVPSFKRGRVYVIDIWAPWCVPCLAGMAHLTELQRRYADRDLVVIGLTGPDNYGSTLEAAEKVVRERPDAIGYSIAWDVDHANYDRWMATERDQGWPWSFIVDRKGKLAFSGPPEGLDGPLEQVIAGTYDLDNAAALYDKRLQAIGVSHELRAVVQAKKWAEVQPTFERMLRLDNKVAGPLVAPLYRKLLLDAKDQAALFGARVVNEWFHDDDRVLQGLADVIVDRAQPSTPQDLDLAVLAARRAVDVTESKNVGALTTLARALFLNGDRDQAIAFQQSALELADAANQTEIRNTLEEYRRPGP